MGSIDMCYQASGPDLAAVQAMRGLMLLDFGTDWCSHCMAACPPVDTWIEHHDGIGHLKIEDVRGLPLGRAYQVKLWPMCSRIRP
ncbi:MAG: thioredoxin family protein [Thermomonas sp.]